jgi:Spy/CpxP family protein refolding chaperone
MFMLPHIILGAVGGFAAARWLGRARHQGCGGRRGFGAWRRHGLGGPRMFFRLLRELDLDRTQWKEVEALFHSLRHDFDALHFDRARGVVDLAGAFGAEQFDRARAEAAVVRHAETQTQLGQGIAGALARLHEILTPEQRQRLRVILDERFGPAAPAPGPSAGPYR